MDLVHDRGSMDLVHESGPWTRSKEGVHGSLVHVLSSPLFNSTSYMHFFQSTMALGFYYSIIPKPFVTTACKFNSSRKFSSLLTIIPLQPR